MTPVMRGFAHSDSSAKTGEASGSNVGLHRAHDAAAADWRLAGTSAELRG